MPARLVLATASPRRHELMRILGLPFEVLPSDADETLPVGLPLPVAVEAVATRKALQVSGRVPDAMVLGADTVVVAQGEALGKPESVDEARRMLRALSGATHTVVTGICLVTPRDNGERRVVGQTVESLVGFGPLTDAMIDAYVATGEPMDKAGAYGIQGRAALFVERIEGDYFNVVGLPVFAVARMLADAGYPWWGPAATDGAA